MLRFSSSLLLAACVGLSLGGAVGLASCSMADGAGDGFGGAGTYTSVTASVGTGSDAPNDVLPDAPQPPAPLSYKYLCGDGDCVPGKDLTCSPNTSASSGSGATAGATTSAGATTGSGALTSSSVSAGSGGGGFGGAGGGGGEGGGSAGPVDYTCRVVIDDGKAASVCDVAGTGKISDPCQTNDHCGPGLACVEVSGPSNVGLCLPYCCDELEDCADGTFCNPRVVVESPNKRVPVCEAAVECSLLTPGVCPDGKVCSVVRADGTTSCVDRGDGRTCDPCPCDDGYVCNPNINQCRKLCHTDALTNECGGGTCQGGSGNYPMGIGICVGGESVCD